MTSFLRTLDVLFVRALALFDDSHDTKDLLLEMDLAGMVTELSQHHILNISSFPRTSDDLNHYVNVYSLLFFLRFNIFDLLVIRYTMFTHSTIHSYRKIVSCLIRLSSVENSS